MLSMGAATQPLLFGLGDDIMAVSSSLPAPEEEEGGGQAGPGLLPLGSPREQETETTDTQLHHPVSWAAAPRTPAQAAGDGGGLGPHLAPGLGPLPDRPGRKHMTTCWEPRGSSTAQRLASEPCLPRVLCFHRKSLREDGESW